MQEAYPLFHLFWMENQEGVNLMLKRTDKIVLSQFQRIMLPSFSSPNKIAASINVHTMWSGYSFQRTLMESTYSSQMNTNFPHLIGRDIQVFQ